METRSEEPTAVRPRQYYSGWVYRRSHDYHFCKLFCRTTATARAYDYYYCIFYPSRPRYIHYYDTVTRCWWGRLDLQGGPDQRFSLLRQADRRPQLKDIPESAYPQPGPMPPIPGAEDGEPIRSITELPPGVAAWGSS